MEVLDRFAPGGHAELAVHSDGLCLHRVVRDVQALSDFVVREVGAEVGQQAQFRLRQRGGTRKAGMAGVDETGEQFGLRREDPEVGTLAEISRISASTVRAPCGSFSST